MQLGNTLLIGMGPDPPVRSEVGWLAVKYGGELEGSQWSTES